MSPSELVSAFTGENAVGSNGLIEEGNVLGSSLSGRRIGVIVMAVKPDPSPSDGVVCWAPNSNLRRARGMFKLRRCLNLSVNDMRVRTDGDPSGWWLYEVARVRCFIRRREASVIAEHEAKNLIPNAALWRYPPMPMVGE